ncbi:hypothetical protein BGW41_007904 [Actinomortierella wolfii]|nr:hypothetical protein BGW41_007904 [Actinomortierella wolfii]
MKVHQRTLVSLGLGLLLALTVSAQSSSAPKPSPPPNPTPTTTPRPIVTSSTVNPPQPTATVPVTVPPRVTSTAAPPRPTTPATSAAPPPPQTSSNTTPQPGGPCSLTSHCASGQMCAWEGNNGICKNIPNELCASQPRANCMTHDDCKDVAFSYCLADETGRKICGGFGNSGNVTDCLGAGRVKKPEENNTNKVLMYAGIGVGSVAALAILFALVRWQRRRKRSRMPTSMFGEIDYGMSNRHSGPRSSTGNANLAGGGGGSGGDNEYPFSGRPNAAQSNNGNYDDQYYDDSYAQNMHPMAGMAGGKVGEAGYYDQQGYNNNHYDPNYDQGYYNQGYDQGYNNAGGYNNGGGYNNNAGGFYDDTYSAQAGYNQYDAKSTAVGGPTSPVSAPPQAHSLSPRQGYNQPDYGRGDQYGVEPSELDFGGHNKGSHNPQYTGGGQGYGHY